MQKLMIALFVTLSFGTTSAMAVPATSENCLKTLAKAVASAKQARKPNMGTGITVTENVALDNCKRWAGTDALMAGIDGTTDGDAERIQGLKKVLASCISAANDFLHAFEKMGAKLDKKDYLE